MRSQDQNTRSVKFEDSSGEGLCEQQLDTGSVILKDRSVPHTQGLSRILKGSRLVKHFVIRGVRCVETVVGRCSLYCVGAERVETVVGQASERVIMQEIYLHVWSFSPWFPLLLQSSQHNSHCTRLDSVTISFSDHLIHDLMSSSSSHFEQMCGFLRENERSSELNITFFDKLTSTEFAFPKCLIRWNENCVKISGFKNFSNRQYLFVRSSGFGVVLPDVVEHVLQFFS